MSSSGLVAGVDPTGGSRSVDVAVAFTRRLRRAGLDVPIHATVTFVEAIDLLGPVDRQACYWAGRTTLVHRAVDLERYDDEFARFFDGCRPTGDTEPAAQSVALGLDDGDADEVSGADDEPPELSVRFSRDEILRHRDFGSCTPEELQELHRAIARLRVGGATRRSRRRRPSRRSQGLLDLRRTLRHSIDTGGDIVERRWTVPGIRLRRLVLLVDVSGSMEPYARTLVRFAHAASSSRRSVEVFGLGTRLTRLTRALAGHDPDQALRAAGDEVADWSGGTRLGDALASFNDRWGARGLARGATVVILSDGWDRGDPSRLGDEMARLARVAHRVVWVNPLAGVPGWTPTAGGMAAALPSVDDLLAGHDLASLEELAELVASMDAQGRRSREQQR